MEKKQNISELKFAVLVEAISAIDIIGVDVKSPNDNNIHLYIKTNDLSTVNSEKLEKLCSKFTTDEIYVTFQIPIAKVTDGINEVLNTDLICIFIELLAPFDPESFVAFG